VPTAARGADTPDAAERRAEDAAARTRALLRR
jgi:hypothetical protein